MKRKSQITVFIIIGIVLLLVVGFTYHLSSVLRGSNKGTDSDVVTGFVKNCVTLTTEEGLILLGSQGGYLDLSDDNKLESKFIDETIALGLLDGQMKMPGLNNIKDDLEKFVTENTLRCIDNFKSIKNPALIITTGTDVKTNIIFTEGMTIAEYTMPLKIEHKQTINTMDTFRVQVPIRMKHVYETVYNAMESTNYPGINMTNLGNKQTDVDVLVYDDSQIYIFKDSVSQIFGEDYMFIVGVA